MKKKLIFLICFLGMIFMNCYHEVNNDIEIKIDNNSSQDLHISFSPNIFTDDSVGVTYSYNDVDIKKGASVTLIVKYRYRKKNSTYSASVYIGPHPRSIKKIIFSKLDTGELIKEVNNVHGIIIEQSKFHTYFFEITDELLGIEGESK